MWILVWWVINPGHPQAMHLERGFESRAACTAFYEDLPAHKPARWHCTRE